MTGIEPPFSEDCYGSVKRLRVFWEWTEPLRVARGGRPLHVLDFGCGTGRGVAAPFAAAGDQVHGVDAHADSIEHARREHVRPNLTFAVETADDLRRRDARFDVVVCSEVLEHLDDPGRCLRDLRSILAEDGRLFITVPNGVGAFEILSRLKRGLDHIGANRALDRVLTVARSAYCGLRGRRPGPRPEETPFFDHGGHVQFFRLARLPALLREAGWDVIDRRGRVLLCGPYVDFWISALRLCRANAAAADRLPLAWAADWMFCARPSAGGR
jgi:SAM-dependent methyltransferase